MESLWMCVLIVIGTYITIFSNHLAVCYVGRNDAAPVVLEQVKVQAKQLKVLELQNKLLREQLSIQQHQIQLLRQFLHRDAVLPALMTVLVSVCSCCAQLLVTRLTQYLLKRNTSPEMPQTSQLMDFSKEGQFYQMSSLKHMRSAWQNIMSSTSQYCSGEFGKE